MDVLAVITPALFTSRLTSVHSSAARATPPGSVMSSATGVTPASVTAAGSRAAPYTLAAPRLTSSAANTRPRPRPAPVTRATDPAIFIKPPRGWISRGNQNRGVRAIAARDRPRSRNGVQDRGIASVGVAAIRYQSPDPGLVLPVTCRGRSGE